MIDSKLAMPGGGGGGGGHLFIKRYVAKQLRSQAQNNIKYGSLSYDTSNDNTLGPQGHPVHLIRG